jgi:hypothetical protein
VIGGAAGAGLDPPLLCRSAAELDPLAIDFGEGGIEATDPALAHVDSVIRNLGPSELTVEGSVA